VHVYSLRGLASSVSDKSDHLFVGRQAELQQFTGILKASQETGSGQAVLLRGEAGIGKTRLSSRFAKIAHKLGYDCHRVLVLDFGVSKEQGVLRTLICSLLSISSDSKDAVRIEAAEQSCSRELLGDGQRVFLNELLDIPQSAALRSVYDALDSDGREQGRINTVTTLIGNLSKSHPILVTVENVHWADETNLHYLGGITKSLVDHPSILVMTSRIEGDPINQTWKLQAAATPLATIDLKPLRQDDAMALAADFLKGSPRFVQKCIERAGGNPLFLEQLLKSADEVGECQVPGSVHSIVQARLDSLNAVDKLAVQAASVLGQRFKLDDLRHMIDEAGYTCTGLIERSLVRKEGEAYLFAHALVQEAVYQSLLKSRRATLHKRAAEWYRRDEPQLCAMHLDRAGDPTAAQAYCYAAKIQLGDLQFKSGLDLAERGLELVEVDDSRCELMLVRVEALRNMGEIEKSIAACKTALKIADNGLQACQAQLELAEGLRIMDQQTPALDALDTAESIASEHDLIQQLIRIKYLRGNLYFMLGNIDGCLAEHKKSLQLAEEAGSAEGRALALGGLGDAYYLTGAMHSAKDQYQACIDLCREHGFGRIEVANRNMVGWSRMYLMEFPQGMEDALASIELAAKVSHHRAEVLSLELAGTVEVERGRMAEARTYLERCLEISTRMDAGNFIAQTYMLLARQTAAIGQVAEAQSFISKAVNKVREVGMVFIGPAVLSVHAELTDDPAQRLSSLQEAEALLDKGSVSHNYFTFCRVAIEISLREEAWGEVERHALRLQSYTSGQPLAWSDFIIARGRALSAWGQGDRSDDLKRKIKALHDQAVQADWKRVLPALEEVLKE
jgi:tetratricopeptide (TPR) repeat protein